MFFFFFQFIVKNKVSKFWKYSILIIYFIFWKKQTNVVDCRNLILYKNKSIFFLLKYVYDLNYFIYLFLVFNATFSNISAISWWPVLVVEKAEYPERTTDHGQATGNLYHLRLRVECTLFCNLQSRVRTHAVLVIGLYELLDPTT